MGLAYGAEIYVGYDFRAEDVLKLPRVNDIRKMLDVHMEGDYDDDLLLEYLAKDLEAKAHLYGDSRFPYQSIVFTPINHPEITSERDVIRDFSYGGDLQYSSVKSIEPDLDKLGEKLSLIGLNVGVPKIVLAWTVD